MKRAIKIMIVALLLLPALPATATGGEKEKPKGEVIVTQECEKVTVTNNLEEPILIGHHVSEAEPQTVAPGETKELSGAPGIEWYVYLPSKGKYLKKGTFKPCPTTTTIGQEDTTTTTLTNTTSSTVSSSTTTSTTPQVDTTTATPTTDPAPTPTVPSDSSTPDDPVDTLPYTGPVGIMAAILGGSALIGGGVRVLRKEKNA